MYVTGQESIRVVENVVFFFISQIPGCPGFPSPCLGPIVLRLMVTSTYIAVHCMLYFILLIIYRSAEYFNAFLLRRLQVYGLFTSSSSSEREKQFTHTSERTNNAKERSRIITNISHPPTTLEHPKHISTVLLLL